MNATRRTVLLGGVAALAAAPAFGQGGEAVEIAVDGGTMAGLAVRPAGEGAHAAVLVVGDRAGTDGWPGETARRLAEAGYFGLALDLWAGAPSDEAALARLGAARAWAGENGADGSRVAMSGLGDGGRLMWLAAAGPNPPKAAVAWGGTVGAVAGHPTSPMDVAASLGAPVLGLYGKTDKANTRERLLRLESAATAAKRTVSLVVYVGAAADFPRAPENEADRAASLDGWERMLAWLKRYDA